MRARPVPSTLDAASFEAIAKLAYNESGLTLVREKATMVQSRLRHRLRELGLESFAQYSTFVHSSDGLAERRQLISALTTNVTQFFRETHHFDEMCNLVQSRLPELRMGGRLRIWSAGCSNGSEPLSAVIALLEQMPELADLDLRILATDIDNQVIKFAREGRYSQRQVTGLPSNLLEKYFDICREPEAEISYVARPELLSMIRHNELNLLGEWPMKNHFDVIFCRNVVIYFDLPTQEALWPRFYNVLGTQGLLFLGHSERIVDPQVHQFHFSGPTTYRKGFAKQ